jgi:hypothetical protein
MANEERRGSWSIALTKKSNKCRCEDQIFKPCASIQKLIQDCDFFSSTGERTIGFIQLAQSPALIRIFPRLAPAFWYFGVTQAHADLGVITVYVPRYYLLLHVELGIGSRQS